MGRHAESERAHMLKLCMRSDTLHGRSRPKRAFAWPLHLVAQLRDAARKGVRLEQAQRNGLGVLRQKRNPCPPRSVGMTYTSRSRTSPEDRHSLAVCPPPTIQTSRLDSMRSLASADGSSATATVRTRGRESAPASGADRASRHRPPYRR